MMSSVSNMSIFLDVRAIESTVLELRPEMVGRVREVEAGRPLLSFEVAGLHVVAGLVGETPRGGITLRAWMVTGGSGDRTSFWLYRTDPRILARAVVARIDATRSNRGLASPWRSDEATRSPLTDLPDALDAGGAPVTEVVAHNRCVATVEGPNLELRHAPDTAGHYLQIVANDREEVLRVALRPTLGWTLDRTLPTHTARLDLGRLLTRTTTSAPGVPQDGPGIDQLAEAVLRVLDSDAEHDEFTLPSPQRPVQSPPDDPDDELDVAQTVARWLRWFGFQDASPVATKKGHPAVHASHASPEIRISASPVGIGAIQRLAGVASVDHTQPIMFSSTGYTKNAVAWADKAGVALFLLDDLFGGLQQVNAVANAMRSPLPDGPPQENESVT